MGEYLYDWELVGEYLYVDWELVGEYLYVDWELVGQTVSFC